MKYKLVLATFLYLLIVLLPLIAFFFIKMIPEHHSCESPDSMINCAESRGFLILTVFSVISAAAVFGSLGAIFSILSRKSDGHLLSWAGIISICFFGSLTAVILCLIFSGGFIGGILFPQYSSSEQLGWFGVIYDPTEFSKLLVWSFALGFSERVLPNFLDSLVKKFKIENKESNDIDDGRGDSPRL